MPDTDPTEPSERHRPEHQDAGTKAVEDVEEFFMAHGEADSPTSDSDDQPPG
jgi:hypothetical protein